ncbi:hypothetical protein POVWA2_061410 [Plasmodium ovale wallikeri]|uniref:Uncharacterized protein n=1 Tax=Plasmodium ovale wallikeri TaxID=864142 RepID=A0A1A9A2M4_PLAOA|nr:hypothetical protein POVWA1_061850 [Plasmodium ovale wallikeri]SBT50974.1 hypothetical protein POVWA2_061410 [Plasmodium ovale wallikeri]
MRSLHSVSVSTVGSLRMCILAFVRTHVYAYTYAAFFFLLFAKGLTDSSNFGEASLHFLGLLLCNTACCHSNPNSIHSVY